MATPFRMPKKIEYPGGYNVVIIVTPREHIVEQEHGEFDPVTRQILIAKDLTPPERRWVMLHEKKHADADHELWFHQTFSVKAPEGVEVDPAEVPEDDEVPYNTSIYDPPGGVPGTN